MSDVGDGINHAPGSWEFDAGVVPTFDDHIAKSVLLYAETRQICAELSDWFLGDGGWVYDLGCSTGTLIRDLMERHPKKDVHYVGVDNSEAMLARARQVVGDSDRVQLLNENFERLQIDPRTRLVYSLYSLQFVSPADRYQLVKQIADRLSPRAGFILVEKVIDNSPVIADIYHDLHWNHKTDAGFSAAEIWGKSQAIRGVMVPFTEAENIAMLRDAGFREVSVFVKGGNFAGILAIK
jgi:tRNA (cmo5U34)-methyltransferase